MKTFILIALLALLSVTAHADVNLATVDDGTHVVGVTTGAENGLVLGAGYAHGLSFKDQPLVLHATAALQWAEVDVSDFKLSAGVLVPLVGYGHWKVAGNVASTIRGTDNALARMINVGADFSVLAGRYTRRWFAAAEVGYDWALVTHVDHSDEYRMTVYEDARDGWYSNTGGMLRFGLQAGVSFGNNDVTLRGGRLQSDMFPFYATLGYDRRF